MLRNILLALVISGPILVDVLNGFIMPSEASLSVGQMLRGVLLVFPIVLMVVAYSPKFSIPLLIISTLLLLKQLVVYFVTGGYAIHMELSILMKILYPMFIALLLTFVVTYLKNCTVNDLMKHLVLYATIIAIGILSGLVFDLHKTYKSYSYGTTGIFLSPNDPGVALLVTSGAATWLALKSKSWLRFVPLIMISSAMVVMGSRTTTMSAIIIPLAVIGLSFFSKDVSGKNMVMITIVGGAMLVFGAYYAITMVMEDPYMLLKFAKLVSGEHPHEIMYETGRLAIQNRPYLLDFIGEGVTPFMKRVQATDTSLVDSSPWGKRVEVDWLDLLGFYGIFVMLLIYTFYFGILAFATWMFVKTRKLLFGVTVLSVLFFLVHSILAGHAIFNPMAGGGLAVHILLLWKYKELAV